MVKGVGVRIEEPSGGGDGDRGEGRRGGGGDVPVQLSIPHEKEYGKRGRRFCPDRGKREILVHLTPLLHGYKRCDE